MYLLTEEIAALLHLIEAHQRIIIHRHVRPDPDAIGSQLALKQLIQTHYPDKDVLAAGSDSQSLLWLGEMDKVRREDYQHALVIVVDTANQERIDGKYYEQGAKIIKIDHHPQVDNYGDLQIVYPAASSTSEILALIALNSQEKLALQAPAAELLYAGMVADTNRFMYDSTSATTLEVAAALTRLGINTFAINDHFNTMSVAQAKLQAYVLDKLEFSAGGVASITLSQETLAALKLREEDTNAITSLPGQIEGIIAWAIIVEQAEGQPRWRIRLRSKGPTINQLAEKYGGGGHAKASGASLQNLEEKADFLKELEQITAAYKGRQ